MLPQTHFLFPFALALILDKFQIIPWQLAILTGVIGVLVDLDHLVEHIIHAKKNKFSLRATWNNSIKLHHFNQRSFIHHWRGALFILLLLVILSLFYWKISLIIAIGYYSHLFLDFSHLTKGKAWRIKLGKYYFQESTSEIIFDLILVVLIVILLLI